jgi:hypothetical protein
VNGSDDFMEREDVEEEVEIIELDIEEEGVLQNQAHPWTVIMLVY